MFDGYLLFWKFDKDAKKSSHFLAPGQEVQVARQASSSDPIGLSRDASIIYFPREVDWLSRQPFLLRNENNYLHIRHNNSVGAQAIQVYVKDADQVYQHAVVHPRQSTSLQAKKIRLRIGGVLIKVVAASTKRMRQCSKCKRYFASSEEMCPYDGTFLVNGGTVLVRTEF